MKLSINKKIQVLGIIIVLIIGICWTVYYLYINQDTARRSRAAGDEVRLSTTVDRTEGANGIEYSVKIIANSQSSFLLGQYSLNINFNKDQLQFLETQYLVGERFTGAKDNPDVSDSNSPNNTGNLIAIANIVNPITGIPVTENTPKDLATVKFRLKQGVSEPVTITINTTDDSVSTTYPTYLLKVDSSGIATYITTIGGTVDLATGGITPTEAQPTATPTTTAENPTATPTTVQEEQPTPTVTPDANAAILPIKIKFSGIPKKPADQYNNFTVKVSVKRNGAQEMVSATTQFTADENGIWSGRAIFNSLPTAADYKVFIKGPKHLQKKFCSNTPTETEPGTYHCGSGTIALGLGTHELDLSGVIIPAGDLPENGVQNGIINSYDLSVVRNIFDRSDEERRKPESLTIADINLDGYIDAQDYSLIIFALGTRLDEED